MVSDQPGYAVEIESFDACRPGYPKPVRWSNRVTQIFRRERDEWRLVHRHTNRLEDGPALARRD